MNNIEFTLIMRAVEFVITKLAEWLDKKIAAKTAEARRKTSDK